MRKFALSTLVCLGLITALSGSPGLRGLAQNPTEVSTAVSTPDDSITPGASAANPLLNPCTNQPFHTILSGADIVSVTTKPSTFDKNVYWITLTINDSGSAVLKTFTTQAAKVQGQLAIVLDGQIIMAPTVQGPIEHEAVIQDMSFDEAKATQVAIQIQSGALPVKLVVKASSLTATGLQYTLIPLTSADPVKLQQAQKIMRARLISMGIKDAEISITNDQIVVTLIKPVNPEAILEAIRKPALLEFVDFIPPAGCQTTMPQVHQYIQTDFQIQQQN